MATIIKSDAHADLEALCASVAKNTAPDPELVRRIQERAATVKSQLAMQSIAEIAVQLVREIRDE